MPKQQPKSNYRWLLILQLYIAAVAWGVIQVFTQHSGLYYMFALFMASAAALWTVSDARSRGRPILHVVQFLVFLFWPLAVPVYLISTRGFRGVGWSIIHGMGLLASLAVSFYATLYFAHGPNAFAGQP